VSGNRGGGQRAKGDEDFGTGRDLRDRKGVCVTGGLTRTGERIWGISPVSHIIRGRREEQHPVSEKLGREGDLERDETEF